ncbi:MAG: hypothetical protein IKF19_00095 [Bacilli bacterium]|nr:hypothetical protein [Bacilli bacterium]
MNFSNEAIIRELEKIRNEQDKELSAVEKAVLYETIEALKARKTFNDKNKNTIKAILKKSKRFKHKNKSIFYNFLDSVYNSNINIEESEEIYDNLTLDKAIEEIKTELDLNNSDEKKISQNIESIEERIKNGIQTEEDLIQLRDFFNEFIPKKFIFSSEEEKNQQIALRQSLIDKLTLNRNMDNSNIKSQEKRLINKINKEIIDNESYKDQFLKDNKESIINEFKSIIDDKIKSINNIELSQENLTKKIELIIIQKKLEKDNLAINELKNMIKKIYKEENEEDLYIQAIDNTIEKINNRNPVNTSNQIRVRRQNKQKILTILNEILNERKNNSTIKEKKKIKRLIKKINNSNYSIKELEEFIVNNNLNNYVRIKELDRELNKVSKDISIEKKEQIDKIIKEKEVLKKALNKATTEKDKLAISKKIRSYYLKIEIFKNENDILNKYIELKKEIIELTKIINNSKMAERNKQTKIDKLEKSKIIFKKNKRLNKLKTAYNIIKNDIENLISNNEEFQKYNDEQKSSIISKYIKEHKKFSNINNEAGLIIELKEDIAQKFGIVTEKEKKWYQKALSKPSIIGFATGIGLSVVLKANPAGTVISFVRLGYSATKFGVKIYSKNHPETNDKIVSIKKAIKEKLPNPIANGVSQINTLLRNPNTQFFLNGVAAGYLIGNIGQWAYKQNHHPNINKSTVSTQETLPNDTTAESILPEDTIKKPLINDDILPKAPKELVNKVPKINDRVDVRGLIGYQDSYGEGKTTIIKKLAKNAKIVKEHNGYYLLKSTDGDPLAWFLKSDVEKKGKILSKVAKVIGKTRM